MSLSLPRLFLLTVLVPGLAVAVGAQPTPSTALIVLSKQDHTLAIVDPATLHVLARIPVGDDPHEVSALALRLDCPIFVDDSVLKSSKKDNAVASKIIATVDDLEQIAADDHADVGALHGWRRELFGDAALSLKHGRLALAIEGGSSRGTYSSGMALALAATIGTDARWPRTFPARHRCAGSG